MQLRMCRGERFQGFRCEHARLIEAPLRMLRFVERHRHNEHVQWRFCRKSAEGQGQHLTEPWSRCIKPVVLERMDCFLHSAIISAERDSFYKWGWSETARSALCELCHGVLSRINGVSAARAHVPGAGGEF